MIKWLKRWLPIILPLALFVWWLQRRQELAADMEEIEISVIEDTGPALKVSRPADDLTVIEGVGPKVAALLEDAGVHTYGALAARDAGQLRQILRRARLPFVDPETWPEQATLAAAGQWDALETLQDGLRGGRRV
jgi:predicted flap endonuclease-1-like 5' DNA nuclease